MKHVIELCSLETILGEFVQKKMKQLGVTGFSSRGPVSLDQQMRYLEQIESIWKARAEAAAS